MASSALQVKEKRTNKREMGVTPFGSQLDDINKALFDYRYRKQTQQQHHHNNNNNGGQKFYSGGAKNQMRSVPHNQQHQQVHHNNPHPRAHHKGAVGGNMNLNGSGVAVGNSGNGMVSALPVSTPMVQNMSNQGMQIQAQQQPFQPTLLQHPKPEFFAQQMVNGNRQGSSGSEMSIVAAASPDSFVEELVSSRFDPFNKATNLSSSVSSAGGDSYGSSSHIEEYNFKEFNVNVPNVPNDFKSGFNNNNYGQNGFDQTVLNNNNRSDKNFGWLKIWGNDMSVWG